MDASQLALYVSKIEALEELMKDIAASMEPTKEGAEYHLGYAEARRDAFEMCKLHKQLILDGIQKQKWAIKGTGTVE